MDHFRSRHRGGSELVVANLSNGQLDGISQCNLMELTDSWERQNRVYVHFKSVTGGAHRPKSTTVQERTKLKKPNRSFLSILKSVF